MKILRKNNDFKKVPDKTINDALEINRLIKLGWNYCPKKDYKNFHKTDNETVKDEKASEKPSKTVKEKKK